jgi:hypothetical protein
LARKLEETGFLMVECGEHWLPMPEEMGVAVHRKSLACPKELLRRLSQETGYSYPTCQWATKKAKIRLCRITVVHHLQEPEKEKTIRYCQGFQKFVHDKPGILWIMWFIQKAWFHLRMCKLPRFENVDHQLSTSNIFFQDRIISKNLWPPRLPDLTSPDFFLFGYVKECTGINFTP